MRKHLRQSQASATVAAENIILEELVEIGLVKIRKNHIIKGLLKNKYSFDHRDMKNILLKH